MTDPYTLRPSAVRHPSGCSSGLEWSVRLRLPWFRALPMSGVESIVVSLDGQPVPESLLLTHIDGRPHNLTELQGMSDRYWSVDEDLQIGVAHGQGPPGACAGTVVTVELTLRMPDGRGHNGDWPRRTVRADTTMIDPHQPRWPLGVCTFSFAGELRRGRSIRSCLREVSAIGYTALEVLGAQVVAGYPNPSTRWLGRLADLMREYGLALHCYDAFLDPGRRPDDAADDELLRWMERELSIAASLGCSFVRLNVPPDPRLFEQLAASAERHDLAVLTELHAQTAQDPSVQELLALLDDLRSPRLGLVVDLSCVMRTLPAGWVAQVLRAGGPPEAARIIENGWRDGLPLHAVRSRLADLGLPMDAAAARLADRTYRLFRRSDTGWLPEVLPYTRIIHGKFFEMEAAGEPTIDYADVLAKLSDAGFDGHIMSEYEGHLWSDSSDAVDQLSKHHAMIAALSNV
ncbi:TIM barrel protein [Dactylosporangium sp. CA-233914]|uniref:TIM barrel protein n=1 Tax=Dactylosporangium sp. CA-233914 TaxID=3239934 RepID=UPI003D9492D3